MSKEKKKQEKKKQEEDVYGRAEERERAERTERAERAGHTEPKKKEKMPPNPNSAGNQLFSIFLVVLALFIGICYAFTEDVGIVGGWIRDVLFGIFGISAFAIPFLMAQIAFFRKRDVASGAYKYKDAVAFASLLFLAAICHTLDALIRSDELISLVSRGSFYSEGMAYHGGGVLGGLLASSMVALLGYPGMLIFSFLFWICFTLTLFGLTPRECVQRIHFYRERHRKIRAAAKAKAEVKTEPKKQTALYREPERAEAGAEIAATRHAKIDSAIFADDFEKSEEENETEILRPIHIVKKETEDTPDDFPAEDEAVLTHELPTATRAESEAPLPKSATQKIIRVIRRPLPTEEAPAVPPKPAYQFPPISLLQLPPASKNTDVSAELRENADRIVETLDNFNVHVTISNISRGPTVTRYELEPSAGTRVRSILNLLDDIALSLATSGVRSDGVIAGKSAIGIEVPNKTVNTVYVRELVGDKRFDEAKSRLTTCLGMDVSGAPVYLDIAKMPHLLIAGATGMGKSVCINSLLVSLLYKARPDEVKLILIDPKKVELNMYNGLPHLLVPVVFDPKKAAGSLHWAVTEMERRFELIEAQNTRNIEQYNKAVEGDPNKERLSQVVIIIDELADLMMTAPDDVEASICRLAQKARAAGMHLILGTQRPSVDVITGLIKANIPSRIAFRSSSQIDSRTILDQQGAEKLIGRGDMLYAPVGSDKPIRVQGAYVSETEIDEVVEFIKSHSRECAYSSEVIAEIDKAAEVCGQKKGRASAGAEDAGGEEEEEDPMLESAIELAVESGKISTSLIQRRLSLGYGRAAKLIDVMESRGIVSAPDGQKPRTVLMTREQFLERKMNRADDDTGADDDTPPFDL